jgi:hypothetical protein
MSNGHGKTSGVVTKLGYVTAIILGIVGLEEALLKFFQGTPPFLTAIRQLFPTYTYKRSDGTFKLQWYATDSIPSKGIEGGVLFVGGNPIQISQGQTELKDQIMDHACLKAGLGKKLKKDSAVFEDVMPGNTCWSKQLQNENDEEICYLIRMSLTKGKASDKSDGVCILKWRITAQERDR